ncbi:SPOR domain-containing protein [Phenylobacterium sp.]|uniref:SPOR domain-containing protein n=1 Tax=Phenylobacterium sp. TaxID=1871053 RepID=UPI0035B003BD
MRLKLLAFMSGAAVCAAMAGAAWAQQAVVLPSSLDRNTLVAWLQANTNLDPNSVISVSPANVIGVMAVNRTDAPSGSVFRAQIRSEVISAETIGETGNYSWAADVEVDCQSRKGKVNRILDFPLRNLRGPPREAGGSAEWVSPPSGTHLFTVVSAVCDQGFRRPLAPVQQLAQAPQQQPQLQAQAQPQPRPQAPIAPPPVQQAPASAPQPAPARQAAPSPAPAMRPPVAAPAPQPPRPVAPGPRSPVAVQIGASDSEAGAIKALQSAAARFGDRLAGTSFATVKVDVGGRTLYRALVHGFPTSGDAQGFCAAYKASGHDCFVRSSLPPGAHTIASR